MPVRHFAKNIATRRCRAARAWRKEVGKNEAALGMAYGEAILAWPSDVRFVPLKCRVL